MKSSLKAQLAGALLHVKQTNERCEELINKRRTAEAERDFMRQEMEEARKQRDAYSSGADARLAELQHAKEQNQNLSGQLTIALKILKIEPGARVRASPFSSFLDNS